MKSGMWWHYKFSELDGLAHSGPARLQNVYRVLRAHGWLGRWVYQGDLYELLGKYKATEKSSCADLVHSELSDYRRSSVTRSVMEHLGLQVHPKVGAVQIGANASVSDCRQLALELDLGFGAHGGTVALYPIPGLSHRWMLVKVEDQSALQGFLNKPRYRTTPKNTYGYRGDLHLDEDPEPQLYLSREQAQVDIAKNQWVEPHWKSNFEWANKVQSVARQCVASPVKLSRKKSTELDEAKSQLQELLAQAARLGLKIPG